MPNSDADRRGTALPCCPELEPRESCDTLDFRYRLPWRRERGRVDVILHFRLERCSGALALGDLAYTTTLFPGEKVRLFTSDRHSRWSYDSETELSYRHRTTSEESYYTWAMARSLSDLTIAESGNASTRTEEDWASGGGGASVNLFGIVEIGGGGGGGSFNAESSSDFARNLSRHAESSSSYAAAGVRARSSTSVGEVEQRQHAEGESESQYESSSRVFSNANRCHAVTYNFYNINKIQTVRFSLVAIERSVADPSAPTQPDRRIDPDLSGGVAVLPQSVRATAKDRLEVERSARQAVLEREQAHQGITLGGAALGLRGNRRLDVRGESMDAGTRKKALSAVDEELRKAGLIDEAGKPTERIIAELSWERRETLPTPGLMVKACLDDCTSCEPALQRKIELELERAKLENQLLERRIALLDQAQEYRCCPSSEEEEA